MHQLRVYPWRQKYLTSIWEAGLPVYFFRNKTELATLIRHYRNHLQAEVYIVAQNANDIALLFIEADFLDRRTLIGNLLQLRHFPVAPAQDIAKLLLEIGAAFYQINSDFEQLILRIPDQSKKVIPGNEPGIFFDHAVYPNKLDMRQFAAADFNQENFLVFHFRKHYIAVKVLADQIVNVLFIQPQQIIADAALRKALLRGCFLNEQGFLETERELIRIHSLLQPMDPTLEINIIRQFSEYFSGERCQFDLPYKITEGTAFQKNVWQLLTEIPYGTMLSYEEVAFRMTHDPQKARDLSRAVGAACAKNPLGILIPCHRVIGKDRSLTGFAGGVALKGALLDLEFMNTAQNTDFLHAY